MDNSPRRLRLPAIRLYSPAEIIGGAFRIVEYEVSVLRQLALAPARVVVMLERLEALLTNVEDVVIRVEAVIDAAAQTVANTNTVLGEVGAVLDRVNATVTEADRAVERVHNTVGAADSVVGETEVLVGRAQPLLRFGEDTIARVQPVVEASLRQAAFDPSRAEEMAQRVLAVVSYAERTVHLLQPLSDEVLASLDPHEIQAITAMIDTVPQVAESLRNDVLPVLASLDTVAPEIHEILEVAKECLEAFSGIPGFRFLQRRGDRDDNDE